MTPKIDSPSPPHGLYDGALGRVYVTRQSFLEDGLEYLILPDTPFLRAQSCLIALINSHKYVYSLDEAVDIYVNGHAELFAKLWNKFPAKHSNFVPFYVKLLPRTVTWSMK